MDEVKYRFEEGGIEPTRLITVTASDYVPRPPDHAVMGRSPFHGLDDLDIDVSSWSDGQASVVLKDLGVVVIFGPSGKEALDSQIPADRSWRQDKPQIIAGLVRRIATKAIMLAVERSAPVEFFTFMRQIARKARSDESKVWGERMALLNANLHDAIDGMAQVMKVKSSEESIQAARARTVQ